jgi:ankyrin repeat protein
MRTSRSAQKPQPIGLRRFGVLAIGLCLLGCDPSVPRSDPTADDRERLAPDSGQVAAASASLLEAALVGQTMSVSKALEGGADPNATGDDGRTGLMLAAYGGHSQVLKLLLERGADVDHRDGFGRTALMYAASGPHVESVRLLLEWQAVPDVVDSQEGFTALMFAAAEGQADVVRALLEYGADSELRDVDGETALDFAFQNGHGETAEILSRHSEQRKGHESS